MSREADLERKVEELKQKMKKMKEAEERGNRTEELKKTMRKVEEEEENEERTKSGVQGLATKVMDSQMHEESQSRM